MAGTSQNEDDMITGINVTPLVDVMLVLLIIFMVTANFIVSPSIPVELPQADEVAQDNEENQDAQVWIDKAGATYIGESEDPANDDQLRAYIETELLKNKDAQVLINADTAATHGQVIETIEKIRDAGATKFGFAVQPPDDTEE